MNNKKTSNHNYNKIKEKYNNILKEKQQSIYIEFLDSNIIKFSNNKTFSNKDRKTWMNRIRRDNMMVEKFDMLINDVINLHDLKKEICSMGGKHCWELKRDIISSKLKGRIPWNKGIPKELNPLYGKKISDETKLKISEKNSGKNNGMYGKRMNEEQKKKHSQLMRNKILDGTFTPNTNNRNTHWDSSLDEIKYRSSWEALYKFFNPNSIYEKLRIKYSYNDEEKIYIVDFVDEINKLAIEIKPKNILKTEKSKIKIKFLREWCKENGYEIIIVDENWLIKNINFNEVDYNRFDIKTQEKIKKFYETHKKN